MFSVALVGPDGAGKTTIGRELEAALVAAGTPARYLYLGLNDRAMTRSLPTTRWWFRLRRASGRADAVGPPDPDAVPERSRGVARAGRALKASVWLCVLVAEEWHQALRVRRCVRDGSVAILDRHFLWDFYAYDIAGSSPRSWHQRVHGWLLQHAYPRPDLVLSLDAPGAVLHARKGEGTPELLDRRRADYRALGERLGGVATIDVAQPLADSVRDALAAIRAHTRQL